MFMEITQKGRENLLLRICLQRKSSCAASRLPWETPQSSTVQAAHSFLFLGRSPTGVVMPSHSSVSPGAVYSAALTCLGIWFWLSQVSLLSVQEDTFCALPSPPFSSLFTVRKTELFTALPPPYAV